MTNELKPNIIKTMDKYIQSTINTPTIYLQYKADQRRDIIDQLEIGLSVSQCKHMKDYQ